CLCCATNEVGEAVGKILNDGSTTGNGFEGYSDPAASQQKILRSVLTSGDTWFRTGDLMRKDGQGYFYFIDRLGDTFRWKGENVSTMEVAETITACPGVIEVVVYGVPVPGSDGRAGMATAVVSPAFDFAIFRRHLVESLPAYARPLFLRIRPEIEATATFKTRKRELARQGYDPAVTSDPIYFDDQVRASFVKLDQALYERLQQGSQRL
ncbi:MAG: AMP-binding enzyme, partial [Stellaceae bacterium]